MNDIARLNDEFRKGFPFTGGKVVTTRGVGALPQEDFSQLIEKVKTFDEFNGDNDPHGEHDFGKIELKGQTFFWKIDYYDKNLDMGSDNPANPDVTTRVLTIMLAEEY